MLVFFPEPYEDEIFYSIVARYHFYSGNSNKKNTLIEVFGKDTVIPTLEFPSRLEYLSSQLFNKKYTSDYFIRNHTAFPYYEPFFYAERQQKIISAMKQGSSNGLYALTGFSPGSICLKKYLMYCPKCAEEDYIRLGEAYFHRVHQLQGVMVCHKHECILKEYPTKYSETGRTEFIRFDFKKINLDITYEEDEKLHKQLLEISKTISYLASNNIIHHDFEKIKEKYMRYLEDKNLLTVTGTVRLKQLHEEFKSFHGERFLNLLNSNINESDKSNWIILINQNSKNKVTHPIRNILFIKFLCPDIREFFNVNIGKQNEPFGKSPWPCLNPFSNHYKENTIYNCEIKYAYRSREPLGIFRCNCGFVYTRKGPDKDNDDRYKLNRVKEYGEVWYKILNEYVNENSYSMLDIAEKANCSKGIIINRIKKIKVKLTSKEEAVKSERSSTYKNNYFEQYSRDFLNLIKEHPELSRTEIIKRLKKQCSWFQRNNPEWLKENLPSRMVKSNNSNNFRIDWEERDDELLIKAKSAYNKILEEQKEGKLARITISLIGKKMEINYDISKSLNRLSKTKDFLLSSIETIEDFQVRRIDRACYELYLKKSRFTKSEVIRKSGIYNEQSQRVKDRLEENMKKYNCIWNI